jgi:hypothetical protein
MSSLSQARRLGGLLPPHRASQEHAAHHAEWSAQLSSMDSSDTLYIRGCNSILTCRFHGARMPYGRGLDSVTGEPQCS